MGYVVTGVENVYPFNLMVGLGYLPNIQQVAKFGYNPDLAVDAEENIWDFGGAYTYSTTADIDTISSSSALDTMILHIQGLDSNYEPVTQLVTLNGQTKVTLETPLLRIWRVFNSTATSISGSIYVYVDGVITAGVPDVDSTIRAYIENGNNQTLMMMYTIPAGFTGFLLERDVSLGGRKSGFITVKLWVRFQDSVWRIANVADLSATGTSAIEHRNNVLGPLSEKTDVQMTATGDTLGLTCAASGEIYLVRNI